MKIEVSILIYFSAVRVYREIGDVGMVSSILRILVRRILVNILVSEAKFLQSECY